MAPALARPPGTASPRSARVGADRLRVPDQLVVQQRLTFLLADGDHLVALEHQCVRSERSGDAVADDREQRTALGDRQVLWRPPDRRRARLEVRLDELELAFAEGREMEQLVDRDVLLDRA